MVYGLAAGWTDLRTTLNSVGVVAESRAELVLTMFTWLT